MSAATILGCYAAPPAQLSEAALPAPAERPAAIATPSATAGWEIEARDAIRRALPFVAREGIAWMQGRVSIQDGQACVSCHHVGYALWSHAEARRVGIMSSEAELDDLAATAIRFLDRPSIPRAMSASQVVLAAPQRAEALVAHLLGLQNAAGDWPASGQFPTQRRSIEESNAVATMYSLLALAESPAPPSRDEILASSRRARAWLAGEPPGESTEWLALRLLLASVSETGDETAALRRSLVDRQRQDGGWGFTPDAESDAFSTGQALYALAKTAAETPAATRPAGSATVARGVRYLLAAQGDDGSWQTPSAMISREPSAAKDLIYHFWSTAWATIGLARALDG